MAQSMEWIAPSWSFVWVFTLLLSESHTRRTQTYYMDSVTDCGKVNVIIGGATIYSHHINYDDYYANTIGCGIGFKTEHEGWRIMLRLIDLDIPDRTQKGTCNDALYIFDHETIMTKAMNEAGGNGGLCGHVLPSTLYSTGSHLTIHFRTNEDGPRGRGFKLIVTAYSDDYRKYNTCGSSFLCENKLCISGYLLCDKVDHCGDYTDETTEGRAKCGIKETSLLNRFLSLGVTASVAITVGSLVVIIVCIVAIAICCKRIIYKRKLDNTLTTTAVVTDGTSGNNPSGNTVATIVSNGTSGYSPGSHTLTTVLSNGTTEYNNIGPHHAIGPFGHIHQGYCPMQPVYPPAHSSVYSAYARGQYIHHSGSGYSSQPSSYHPSYTPTSSKSGKSNRSNNSTSVSYSQGIEKVSVPVSL